MLDRIINDGISFIVHHDPTRMSPDILLRDGRTIHAERPAHTHKCTAPSIVCKDGTTLSVQASTRHACTPRDDIGPYTHVEVYFPHAFVGSWIEYYNQSDIYEQVPIDLVKEFVELHGGEID